MCGCRPGSCSASKPISPFRIISSRIRSSPCWRRRASDVVEHLDYVGTVRGRLGYASGHWLLYATGGLAYAGERFINTPADRRRRKAPQRPARLGRRRRRRICLRAALERCGSNISTTGSRMPTSGCRRARNIPRRLDFQSIRVGLNRKIDWPGSPHFSPKTSLSDPESDRWEIHGQTTYLPQGYPALSRALYRHQQPDAGAAGAGDLEQRPVSERAALGGRRGLLQPRTAAGIRLERHRRRRRLSQRRSAEIQLPLPALQHLAAVPAPDLRLRRRAGRTGERTGPARRQGRRLAADAAGRQVRGDGCLRRQRLRQGYPQGLHELVDVGARRVRLFGRQGRPDLRRHRGVQSEAMGVARAAIS